MSEDLDKFNNKIWDIIDSYFNSVDKSLTIHQLDSFNMFLSDKLPKTIKQFTPLKNQWFLNSDNLTIKNTDSKSDIDDDLILTSKFYIGASYDNNNIINDVKNIYIGKPIINQEYTKKRLSLFLKKELTN